MKKVLYQLFILLFATHLQAHMWRLAPETEPLSLVHGCVNVVSGEFVQNTADVVAPGGLTHSRVYDSGNSNAASTLAYGFTWGVPGAIVFLASYDKHDKDDEGNFIDGGTSIIFMEEREGAGLIYHGRHNHKPPGEDGQEYTVRPSVLKGSYTNYSPWGIGGTSSLHNVTLLHRNYKKRERGGTFTVTLGCGTKRVYTSKGKEHVWTLAKELRPDGTRVFYDHNPEAALQKVWMTGPDETVPVVSYTVVRAEGRTYVEASNGQKADYFTHNNKSLVFTDDGPWKWKITRLTKVEGEHLHL